MSWFSFGNRISSIAVADVALRESLKLGVRNVGNIKINKLVFLAHAWHLGYFRENLVEGEVCGVWRHGPCWSKLFRFVKRKSGIMCPDPIHDVDFFADLGPTSLSAAPI